MAFVSDNMINWGPTYFQIPNYVSKFKKRLQCFALRLFIKKKKQNKTKRNISYVHPMKRVDEVGQKRTGNNYRVVGSWGGGPNKLVVSTQSVDHDPNGGSPR